MPLIDDKDWESSVACLLPRPFHIINDPSDLFHASQRIWITFLVALIKMKKIALQVY